MSGACRSRFAEVGPPGATTVCFMAISTWSRGAPVSSSRTVDGERLIGRGAYDMKGALAAMLLALHDLRDTDEGADPAGVVPDEESEEEAERGQRPARRDGLRG